MALVANLRSGLATRLGTVSGLNVYDTPRDRIATPAAMVLGPELITRLTFGGGGWQWDMVIQLLFARADLDTAVDRIDPFMSSTGASSLIAAIEADRTLGLSDTDANVTEIRDFGVFRMGDQDYIGAELKVEVYTND